MIVKLPYGKEVLPWEIPTERVGEILSPFPYPGLSINTAEIIRSIDNPIGLISLEDEINKRGKPALLTFTIIADDNTRPTPTADIMPLLLSKLFAMGVKKENITICVALGTHRPMSMQETEQKFGNISRELDIINHDHKDHLSLSELTEQIGDTPVRINSRVFHADFKIGIGSIVPHSMMGYGGGSKIILPGVASRDTIGALHALYATDLTTDVGVLDNSLRREADRIAARVGLNFIINAVLNKDNQLVQAFSGHYQKAFSEGVKAVNRIYRLKASQKADIVIVSSFSADLEFYQSHKALAMNQSLVKDDGLLVLVSPCPEGIAKTHPHFKSYIATSPDKLLLQVEAKLAHDIASAAIAVRLGLIKKRIKIGLVSSGISKEEANEMGFLHFKSITDILAFVNKHYSRKSTITVVTHGGKSFSYL